MWLKYNFTENEAIAPRPHSNLVRTHQRLDVALHRGVVTTQVGHEAEARHDEVIIVKLAVMQEPRQYWLVKCQKRSFTAGR